MLREVITILLRTPNSTQKLTSPSWIPGIGLAIAKYLLTAPQSHNLVVVARSVEPLQKLKEQYGKQVEVVNGDLADFSLAPRVVDAAIKAFGKLDGMVLNHGVLGQVGKIAEADLQQWKQGLDINFLSIVAFVGVPLVPVQSTGDKDTDTTILE